MPSQQNEQAKSPGGIIPCVTALITDKNLSASRPANVSVSFIGSFTWLARCILGSSAVFPGSNYSERWTAFFSFYMPVTMHSMLTSNIAFVKVWNIKMNKKHFSEKKSPILQGSTRYEEFVMILSPDSLIAKCVTKFCSLLRTLKDRRNTKARPARSQQVSKHPPVSAIITPTFQFNYLFSLKWSWSIKMPFFPLSSTNSLMAWLKLYFCYNN